MKRLWIMIMLLCFAVFLVTVMGLVMAFYVIRTYEPEPVQVPAETETFQEGPRLEQILPFLQQHENTKTTE